MSDRNRRIRGWLAAAAAIALLLIETTAFAQYCTDDTDNIELGMEDLGLGMVEVFFLSDFDPSEAGAHPILFRFSMRNDGPEARTLALGFEVNSAEGRLVQGFSDPFELEAGASKSGTNQDLSNAAHEFQLSAYDISSAGGDLEEIITHTGYLPEGEYVFRLALIEEGSVELEVCTLTAHVRNPRTVVPVYPGGPFGESLPLESSLLPQFQWESRASHFNFRLCPVLPGDGSGEEVMENQPVFEDLNFASGFVGTHIYLYPPSAEMLVHGANYCWQVEAVVPTSSGEYVFPGEIFCFEMEDGTSLTPYDDLLQALLLILPPGTLDDALVDLQGFHSTGGNSVDEIPIVSDELPLLLETLLLQGWELGNVEVSP